MNCTSRNKVYNTLYYNEKNTVSEKSRCNLSCSYYEGILRSHFTSMRKSNINLKTVYHPPMPPYTITYFLKWCTYNLKCYTFSNYYLINYSK